MKILFVHGRSQEKKDPAKLQAEWTQALLDGFRNSGLAAPEELEIMFPYYGDLLFDLVDRQSQEDFSALVERGADETGPDAEQQAFILSIVSKIAAAEGIDQARIEQEAYGGLRERDVRNWPIVLATLRLLNKIEGVSSSAVELLTRDVWYYLTNAGARAAVDKAVASLMPPSGEFIVVAHSLGTVVAYNVLMTMVDRHRVTKFVTLGSPLGIDAIYERVPAKGSRTAPERVGAWFNGRDEHDTVALYEIPRSKFPGTPAVVDYSDIENASDNHHNIVNYLNDARVAREILI